jgi:hypothetical protein
MSTGPTSSLTIACVVEGYGEVVALPVLLRRLLTERISPGSPPPDVLKPHRIPKGSLKIGQLEKAVAAAGNRVPGAGGILVLVDADDDCPGTEGPEWLARARKARNDKPIAVVFAKREFEAWFLAGANSLVGKRGLSTDLAAPPTPEDVRGAKEWLTGHMEGSRAYKETVDQPAMASALDLDEARQGSPSFDKLWREVERLVAPTPCAPGWGA